MRFTRISCREHIPQAEVCASSSLDVQLWGGVQDNTTKHAHDAILPHGSPSSNKSQAALLFFYLLESPTTMSDDEGKEPIQLGKWTLDAIIEGVATKLRESPPVKRPNDGSSSSSAGKGE